MTVLCALCASAVNIAFPVFSYPQKNYHHRGTENTEIIRAVILRVLAPLRDQIKKSRVISQRRRGVKGHPFFKPLCPPCLCGEKAFVLLVVKSQNSALCEKARIQIQMYHYPCRVTKQDHRCPFQVAGKSIVASCLTHQSDAGSRTDRQ